MALRYDQYKQTNPENHLSTTNLERVMGQMSEDERKALQTNADNLENNIQRRRKESGSQAKAMFGSGSSMEILSRLGIFMIAQERAEGDPNKLNLRKPSVVKDLLDSVD